MCTPIVANIYELYQIPDIQINIKNAVLIYKGGNVLENALISESSIVNLHLGQDSISFFFIKLLLIQTVIYIYHSVRLSSNFIHTL